MRIGFESRRPGAGLAAAVVALHLGLAMALLGVRAVPERHAAAPAPAIEVRLIQLAPLTEVARPSLRRELAAGTRPATPGRREAQAITPPPAVAAQPARAAATTEPALAAASAAAPALQLGLPRSASAPERWRHPALDDPRANTPRRTLEAMIAGTMGGDDRLIEEPLGDGRIRYRSGSDCILVQPARGSLIDPFNQSASPTPRLVQPC